MNAHAPTRSAVSRRREGDLFFVDLDTIALYEPPRLWWPVLARVAVMCASAAFWIGVLLCVAAA